MGIADDARAALDERAEVLFGTIDQHTPLTHDEYCVCGATWGPVHLAAALVGDTREFGVEAAPSDTDLPLWEKKPDGSIGPTEQGRAVWNGSTTQPVAAPSDTDREALARALFVASDDFAFADRMAKAWDAPGPHGRTRWYRYADAVLAAGFSRTSQPVPSDTKGLVEAARVVRAYPSRVSEHVASILEERAVSRTSQPVQVEVTDEMAFENVKTGTRYVDEAMALHFTGGDRSLFRRVKRNRADADDSTRIAELEELARDHYESAERSFDHVQILRDRIARIREWVGEHQEHEVYEADSTQPEECTDECIWCPVVAILEEPEFSPAALAALGGGDQ